MNRDEFKALIRQDEGLKLRAYQDTRGVRTCGYGHTGPDVCEGMIITLEQAERWLDEDCAKAVSECRTEFKWFNDLDEKRQLVIASMVFNLGLHGVLKFKNMLLAISMKQWIAAADAMQQSAWAGQVGRRAVELADMMRMGTTFH